MKNKKETDSYQELLQALLLLKTADEADRFLKDLCTPRELSALSERWNVCRLLESGTYSYREINELSGASLATITRVARFLKNEPHRGYELILHRINASTKQGTKK